MTAPEVRGARPDDARPIAEVHVRTWQAPYRGQLPDEFLDTLSVEPREEMWRREIAVPADSRVQVFVTEADGRVVGFVASGPARDEDVDPDATGEVHAIYALPAHWGQGVGRALLSRAEEALERAGFREALLWVLETNLRTRRFYEAAGWRLDGALKTDRIGSAEAREVRYRVALSVPS